MQYMHRRLQRSVTERRRLASGLPSASRSACDGECVRASQFEPTASKVFPPNDTHESQRAARVLPVAAFLAYGESGVCAVESRWASRGGDTSTGSTAETSITPAMTCRSEERRVGKECRSR